MKYCKHCGAELLDEAVVCPKCGCSVEENTPVQTAAVPKPGLTVSIIAAVFVTLMTVIAWLWNVLALWAFSTPVLVLGIIGCAFAARSLKVKKTSTGKASLGLSIYSLSALVLNYLAIIVLVIAGIMKL